MKVNNVALRNAWARRCTLMADGRRLGTEAAKLTREGNKFELKNKAIGSKLRAAGSWLYEAGSKLMAEGEHLWAVTLTWHREGVKIEWKKWSAKKQAYECHLGTGEVFKP